MRGLMATKSFVAGATALWFCSNRRSYLGRLLKLTEIPALNVRRAAVLVSESHLMN